MIVTAMGDLFRRLAWPSLIAVLTQRIGGALIGSVGGRGLAELQRTKQHAHNHQQSHHCTSHKVPYRLLSRSSPHDIAAARSDGIAMGKNALTRARPLFPAGSRPVSEPMGTRASIEKLTRHLAPISEHQGEESPPPFRDQMGRKVGLGDDMRALQRTPPGRLVHRLLGETKPIRFKGKQNLGPLTSCRSHRVPYERAMPDADTSPCDGIC
jgi:hypothetical protein